MPKGQYVRKAKQNKVTEMQQLDGKLREGEELKEFQAKVQARNLDEIMGFKVTSKYKCKTLEEYTRYLNSLNGTDLQSHAQIIGIRPNHELPHLKRSLIAEFVQYSRELTRPQSISLNENHNLSPEVQEILSRGR